MQPSHSGTLQPSGAYNAMLGLGLVQLFCFIANMALGIANAVLCGFMGYIGYGIWGAVICFVAGVTGIVAAKTRSTNAVVLHMVLSIVCAAAATVQLAMGSGSAVVDHAVYKTHHNQYVPYGIKGLNGSVLLDFHRELVRHSDPRCMDSFYMSTNGPIATDALLASFAAIQGIIAILSAFFACRATVCRKGVTGMPWEEFGSHVNIIVPK